MLRRFAAVVVAIGLSLSIFSASAAAPDHQGGSDPARGRAQLTLDQFSFSTFGQVTVLQQRDGRFKIEMTGAAGPSTAVCHRGSCSDLHGVAADVEISLMQLDLRISPTSGTPNSYNAQRCAQGRAGWDLTSNGTDDIAIRWQGTVAATVHLVEGRCWELEFESFVITGSSPDRPGTQIVIDHTSAG